MRETSEASLAGRRGEAAMRELIVGVTAHCGQAMGKMPWLLDSSREKCRGETVDTEAWMSSQRKSQSAATKSKDSMCSCSYRLGSGLSN
jgi:hypothetical protein